MEENMVTPYEYIRMVIEEYGDETDLNKYDNLIGDYKQLFELVKRLQKENEELHKEIDHECNRLEEKEFKLENKINKLKNKMIGDKMEQFDDYIIYLIESYLEILEE